MITLMKHQVMAIDFIMSQWRNGKGAALFHEMGLGKTISALVACGNAGSSRVLVICPLSVIISWREDIKKVGGVDFEIKMINYESAWRRQREILKFDPDTVILDEAHKIKNHRASQSRYCHGLSRIRRRLVLTGTPITQSPLDAWSIFRFLQPDVFAPSYYAFRNRYANLIERERFDTKKKFPLVTGFRRLEELSEKMSTVSNTALKKDCLDLPEKIHQVRRVTLSPAARRIYERVNKDVIIELEREKTLTVNHVLTRLLRLQQVASGNLKDDSGQDVEIGSEKLNELTDLLTGELAGQQAVIYCLFINDIRRIANTLLKLGVSHGIISGDVSLEARTGIVKGFQDGELRILICQQRTGGIGLNLTAANNVIYYSFGWSTESWVQSQDRIHRIGQTKTCFYTYLIAEHTVDEVVYKVIKENWDVAKTLTYWRCFV